MVKITMENLIKTVPEPVIAALRTLEDAGYGAYMVGGCVRDMAMGKKPCDWDMTTSARPEQIKEVFSSEKTLDTGIKHGTVTLMAGGMSMEITTYRVESGYSDHRHPDKVAFSGELADDLARRDFTINAMALDRRGGLTDLFGGLDDIAQRKIRCVGEPAERFEEDALRIMRAMRFASRLEFTIEKNTLAAAHDRAGLLEQISPERLRDELTGILCGRGAGRIILDETQIIGCVVPEIIPCKGFEQKNPHHIYDVLGHIAAAVDATAPVKDLRLAAFFHDIGKPGCFTTDEKGTGHFYDHARLSAEITEKVMKRLRFDNETTEKVTSLVKYHGMQIEPEPKYVKRAMNRLSPEIFFELLALKRADNMAQSPQFSDRQKTYDKLEQIARMIIEDEQCFSLKDMAVRGSDLIRLGIGQRPEIGRILNELLEAVIDGRVANDKDALLELAMKTAAAPAKKR